MWEDYYNIPLLAGRKKVFAGEDTGEEQSVFFRSVTLFRLTETTFGVATAGQGR
jgi:hypothetical protein